MPNWINPAALSVPEAARYTGLSRSSLYRLIGSGELISLKVSGRRLIRRDALEKLLGGHANEPA